MFSDTLLPFENLYRYLFKYLEHLFHDAKGSHDLEHTIRVLKNALFLFHKEGGHGDVILTAAMLHDIGRSEEDLQKGAVCHAEIGAKKSRQFLETCYEDISGRFADKTHGRADFITAVENAVRAHRFRGTRKPQTIEEKIVFDADKLDSIGAVGIGRAFLFAGEVGAKLHNPETDLSKTSPYSREDTAWREFEMKLKFIKNKMVTKTGRKLAATRHRFMKNFFKELNREYNIA